MNQQTTSCPLCGHEVDKLITNLNPEDRIVASIKAQHPGWSAIQGACSRCVDHFHVQSLQEDGFVTKNQSMATADGYVVLPTPLRLHAPDEYTGKGITICFIDSGFYPHPDLTKPSNRILEIVDITNPAQQRSYFDQPRAESWHGTMTTVACAGNGYLSNGLYRGIASQANLVLLKVEDDQGRITGEGITKAIRWAIQHRERYNIRVINLSVSDDWPISYKDSAVDQAAEDAVAAGIVVVAAVGNDPDAPIVPPANSPNVIAVGGLDDRNTLWGEDDTIYHSTYGITVDQFLKPELIAPGIWVAAPILPNTAEHREANALFNILTAKDAEIKQILAQEISRTQLDRALVYENSISRIREQVVSRLAQTKFISPHYTHVDGTSFASPIVASVVAQMLEARAGLIPRTVRSILFTSAQPLKHIPVARQGHGVVQPGSALQKALSEDHAFKKRPLSPFFDFANQKIVFYYHDHDAQRVSLAGNFNNWQPDQITFKSDHAGLWSAEIPLLPNGFYLYKFVIDGSRWIADPENPYREPDGFNGLNSRLQIP